jgi:UDP-2-acetamido-3-amino-2,3-dideoxy-glucuronate N-acetyltransferase
MLSADVRVHRSAEVSSEAEIGSGTAIWNEAQVRPGARVGRECILGKGVYVDAGVVVGDRVKLENRVSLFRGARLGSGVFVGPHSCLLNDTLPRAITPDGRLKGLDDWTPRGVSVEEGASIGGGCTILPGVSIGRFALVGAGSVVTKDVPANGLVVGNPARLVGYVCDCGHRLDPRGRCPACGRDQRIEVAAR